MLADKLKLRELMKNGGIAQNTSQTNIPISYSQNGKMMTMLELIQGS